MDTHPVIKKKKERKKSVSLRKERSRCVNKELFYSLFFSYNCRGWREGVLSLFWTFNHRGRGKGERGHAHSPKHTCTCTFIHSLTNTQTHTQRTKLKKSMLMQLGVAGQSMNVLQMNCIHLSSRLCGVVLFCCYCCLLLMFFNFQSFFWVCIFFI
ncbi:hypothetical protein BCR41DRAFT_881 [Lobosporangium transversale]|uniref:Uncharacterized protein n=1 Tax=Lobosporangium transversale TaxID=64571 RepID=A0A1Y2H234_9FUNG|nr:hypothetical protein BCR41DRAFT_881 [Lobosporangium transversale]ORZ28630.1 hypothetical protein BCR41DRAFT_881 [Lobosporangium transversale]|eukprot:XP_021886303.1 hypothetical protein BCR41DRAFT_881 [Lobosporangium transversale]